jgi:hypothetical protein
LVAKGVVQYIAGKERRKMCRVITRIDKNKKATPEHGHKSSKIKMFSRGCGLVYARVVPSRHRPG